MSEVLGVAGVSGVPASFLRRLGAMVYDALIVVAMWLVTLFPMVAASNDSVSGATVQSVLFLELFAFFAYFWVARGQTLGMLAWRLELVCDPDPQARAGITLKQALWRFVGALLSLLSLGLGHWWMLFDAQRRTWPDMLSHTRVLYMAK